MGETSYKPYSFGIIGTGRGPMSVGWRVAEELCRSGAVEEIFLANRTAKYACALKEYLLMMVSQKQVQRPQTLRAINVCSVEELVEAEPVVTLVALDATQSYGVSWRDQVADGRSRRADFLEANLAEIARCARAFRPVARRYASSVLVCTNPVDILTYVFLRESGLNAVLVAGFNEADSERFRRLLLEEFKNSQPLLEPGDIDACVIGPHSEYAVPVFSQVHIASVPFGECAGNSASIASVHGRLMREAQRWIGLLGTTSPELAPCLALTIEAIAQKRGYQPTLSLRTSYNDVSLCIGQQADLRNGNGIRPVPVDLDARESQQYRRAQEILIDQLGVL